MPADKPKWFYSVELKRMWWESVKHPRALRFKKTWRGRPVYAR